VGGCKPHVPAALPPEMTRYRFYRRLGGPQGRSGRVRNISPPSRYETRTAQLVASHYTDWAISAHRYYSFSVTWECDSVTCVFSYSQYYGMLTIAAEIWIQPPPKYSSIRLKPFFQYHESTLRSKLMLSNKLLWFGTQPYSFGRYVLLLCIINKALESFRSPYLCYLPVHSRCGGCLFSLDHTQTHHTR
jgi:hypothetical protein